MIKSYSRGFIAITTTIILSVILLLVATALSFTGFFTRYNILDSELKKVSVALAEGCVDQGLLMMAAKSFPASKTTIKIGEKYCDLIPVSGSDSMFYAQASSSNYYTNLKISLDPATLSIQSWEEEVASP